VRKVFISYARENKPDVDQLVEHLRVGGCEVWYDSSLRGGQDWWNEILHQIADSDAFIPIISREALHSTACSLEFDWAELLNKPVLPVAVEPPPRALPRRFSVRQIVDYSDRAVRDRAALQVAGGLGSLSAAPPLPDPLPEPPGIPLSYLINLVDLAGERTGLGHDQQRHILQQLEPALRSADPEERQGGYDILEILSRRGDLYADVDRTITLLKDAGATVAPGESGRDEHPADLIGGGSAPIKKPAVARGDNRSVGQLIGELFTSKVGPRGRHYHPKIVASAAVVALVTAIAIVIVATHNRASTQQLSHDRAAGQTPYQAYVLAPKPGLTGAPVYAAPNTSSRTVGNLAKDRTVYIDCVLKGNPVEGPGVEGQPRQTTDLWDKIRPEGDTSDLGFMPDAWVNTNGTAPRAPFC
jgi:hypothetical protein